MQISRIVNYINVYYHSIIIILVRWEKTKCKKLSVHFNFISLQISHYLKIKHHSKENAFLVFKYRSLIENKIFMFCYIYYGCSFFIMLKNCTLNLNLTLNRNFRHLTHSSCQITIAEHIKHLVQQFCGPNTFPVYFQMVQTKKKQHFQSTNKYFPEWNG